MSGKQPDGGKRRRGPSLRCSCPACREPITQVVAAKDWGDGVVVRRRVCSACGHRWFTAQEPEYVVRGCFRRDHENGLHGKPALVDS